MLRVAVAIAPEVRQLLAEDPSQLEALLEEIHAEDLADLLGMLSEDEAAKVLRTLKAEDAAPIFERLDENTQEAMVEHLGLDTAATIASEMSADERTDLIEGLPDAMGDTLLELDAGAPVAGDYRTFVREAGRPVRVSGLLLAALGWREGDALRGSQLEEAFPVFTFQRGPRPIPTYAKGVVYLYGREIARIDDLAVAR